MVMSLLSCLSYSIEYWSMDVNLAADVLGNLVDIKPVTFTQKQSREIKVTRWANTIKDASKKTQQPKICLFVFPLK